MRICFLTLRRSRDAQGWEPDCPDGTSFLLLADAPKSRWGIYEVSSQDSPDAWTPDPVGGQLSSLVASAMRFPPAMALARDDMAQLFAARAPERAEFVSAYTTALETRMAEQSTTSFVFARAIRDEAIDLVDGEWYWVLRISRAPPVAQWVSDDYFVYRTAADNFALTPEQRRTLQDGASGRTWR